MNRTLATILSSVLHPLLVPSYLSYIVCYQLPEVLLPPTLPSRWKALAVVVLFTLALPALGVLQMVRAGLVNSLQMPERRQRTWPLLLAAVSFGVGASLLYMPQYFVPPLPQMLTGMAVAVLLTFLITLRWKISAHGVGMGGAVALLALLHTGPHGGAATLGWLAAALALAVAVSWARLALHAHTPAQVVAGFGLGAALGLSFGLGTALG